MAEVGEVRVAAYLADGPLSADSGYASTLRELGADGNDLVLVAVLTDDERSPASTEGGEGGEGAEGAEGAEGTDGGKGAEGTAGAEDAEGTDRGALVVGTIMLQTWPNGGQVVSGPQEAEIRALAVSPEFRGRGVGADLLRRLTERAAGMGIRELVLCTLPEMRAARRLYERAGFVRRPERDWSPVPGTALLIYDMRLDADSPG